MRDRRFLVPEVVQTSGMDCGPACLAAALAGFGRPVSYGRLRELCRTEVDGTSIDQLEDLATELGLEAEQVLVPAEQVLQELPAMALIQLPDGQPHFVVLWRLHLGGWLQILDPAVGRRWVRATDYLSRLYEHVHSVPADEWSAWAHSEDFLDPLRERLLELGLSLAEAETHIQSATEDEHWSSLARLEAATRRTAGLVRSRAIRRGREADSVLSSLRAPTRDELLPERSWSATPDPRLEGWLRFRGALLVKLRQASPSPTRSSRAERLTASREQEERSLPDRFPRTGRKRLFYLATAGLLASAAVLGEALLFRGLLDLGAFFPPGLPRWALLGTVLLFLLCSRGLQLALETDVRQLGRDLETRFRLAIARKLPRIEPRYFASRPVSDTAERAHRVHRLRETPRVLLRLYRIHLEVLLTTAGMIWIYPRGAPWILLAAATALLVPLLGRRWVDELDLRLRTHQGALTRFYLEALSGSMPLRTHGGEASLRSEQSRLLGEWGRTLLAASRRQIVTDGLQIVTTLCLVVWVVLSYLRATSDPGGVLLLAFWGVYLPFRGREALSSALRWMNQQHILERLAEPLGAPETEEARELEVNAPSPPSILLSGVGVALGGRQILHGIDLSIEAGEHLAVLGPSGAGKTTLLGLLLAWNPPSEGEILFDQLPWGRHDALRWRQWIAWVDPAVYLWNRSLSENLRYGSHRPGEIDWRELMTRVELQDLLEQLPEGLQTPLGEAGGLLSGGEGQRVRIGRGWCRDPAPLVLLDEPFRGLGREQRHRLLGRARERWQRSTLLCVTHDIQEAEDFDRIVVMENGHLVEVGTPDELASRPHSKYRGLLVAEQQLRGTVWNHPSWRRWWMEAGRLSETRSAEGGGR